MVSMLCLNDFVSSSVLDAKTTFTEFVMPIRKRYRPTTSSCIPTVFLGTTMRTKRIASLLPLDTIVVNRPSAVFHAKRFKVLHRMCSVILLSCIVLSSWSLFGRSVADSTTKWVGTWSTAPQLIEPGNMPPAPGLTNNSLRQVVEVSIGGDTLRVKFSNEFSTSAVTMKSVQIAVSTGGNTINISTNKGLKFNGNAEVTMSAGVEVTSDPVAFSVTPRMDVAITIYFGQTSATVTGHPGSRTTSYIIAGNTTTTTDFTGAVTTDHWYNINTIDVQAPSTAACVAILGNSITDGRGSTTNKQNRWPDVFSKALLQDPRTQQVGVLNMGIGGNCVLKGGLGPTGVSRYDRDILSQSGVRWAIVFEGVNDIGGVRSATGATTTANNLIAAYTQMIAKAHARNIRIYGGTITPFKGNGYYNQYSEQCRNTVNQWIRTKGNYDGCIDFDKTMRNPLDTLSLVSTYQNDSLHPDSMGYKTMGGSIDLKLFIGADTLFRQPTGFNSRKTIDGYRLGQNFPNPFNPATIISFGFPIQSFVSLKVYDTLGREVSTLLSEELSAGTHPRQWDATGLASGVYFDRLQAGSFTETKKLILLR
jgi:lysophospholipase L1-like esterase